MKLDREYDIVTIELIEYLAKTQLIGDCVYKTANSLKLHIGDAVAYDRKTGNPKAIFEIKQRKSTDVIKRVIQIFRGSASRFGNGVAYYLVFPGDDIWPFHIYNVTPYVIGDIIEYNNNDFEAMHVALQPKEYINPGETKIKRKKNWLNITCRFIIPTIILSIYLLDVFNVVSLTTNRLILYGVLFVSILIPFYDTITYKDFTLENKSNKDNKD